MTTDRFIARALPVAIVTALVYALVGWLALRLAIPPSYGSPIFPPAGIALAAVLMYGRPALAGAAVGSILVNASAAAERGLESPSGVAALLVIGLGAALQAAFGAALVRRFVSQPLTLVEPVDLARFFVLGAPVACLVSASASTAALVAHGAVPATMAASAWSTWWLGDTLGVMIAAPIALTLIGRPRADWVRRRLVVSLPLLLATALLVAGTAWVIRAHDERVRGVFERDAAGLGDRLAAHLRGPEYALLGMHSLFATQERIDPDEMRRAAGAWLEQPLYLQALGYSRRVARADVAAFQAAARAEGPAPDYTVFDREADGPAAADRDVVAIRYIEPLAENRRALGVNALSVVAARPAIEQAVRSGEIVATASFPLTQSADGDRGTVLYKALYRGEPAGPAARAAAFSGVVFTTLRLNALVAYVFSDAPDYLRWCVAEHLESGALRHTAGPAGCEVDGPAPLQQLRTLSLGGRQYTLQVSADRAGVPGLADGGGWMFAVIGLLASSLLGALLLTVSGRQRRIEAAVDARTAELRRASQALRDSEERLRNIVDHVPIGVVYADAEGRVREANPGLQRMLGLGPDARGQSLLDWIDPQDRRTAAAWIAELRHGRQSLVRGRVRLLGPGAAPVSVQLGLSAQHHADGSPHRLVGVIEDITEHLKLEASERAREQAEAASRAKSEFVGRMSHELRTPLNAMLGFAQLLGRDTASPLATHQQRWAKQIQDAGWHLLNMINDTLDLSMIESGALRLSPRPLDPAPLLQDTLSLVGAAAERRQVELIPPTIVPGTGLLLGDETRVKQILTNLLSNAVKYNVPGGRVEVQVQRTTGHQVVVSVHDTGLGLSPQQIDSLFQPFNRLGREISPIEGTGIGLVISRRLAELMGGSLTVASAEGQGSTFRLALPTANAPLDPPRSQPIELEVGAYRRRLVHYIEDNETNVLLMRGMLAQRPQIDLTVSHLGLDALIALREHRPDLILLDMHLPDIDGLDLLQHLKQSDETAAIPVLVLSADATRERTEQAMAEGAAAYLCKPLDLAEFLAAVDEVLEQADTRWG